MSDIDIGIRSSFCLRYREYLNLPRVSQYLKKPISQLALPISQLALKSPISQKANISTCLANISTCLNQYLKPISQTEPISQTYISKQPNISKVNISNPPNISKSNSKANISWFGSDCIYLLLPGFRVQRLGVWRVSSL